jgi:hypothetical protein
LPPFGSDTTCWGNEGEKGRERKRERERDIKKDVEIRIEEGECTTQNKNTKF